MSNRKEKVWSHLPIHQAHQSAWADLDPLSMREGERYWQSRDYRGRKLKFSRRIQLIGGATVYIFRTLRDREVQLTELEVTELIRLKDK